MFEARGEVARLMCVQMFIFGRVEWIGRIAPSQLSMNPHPQPAQAVHCLSIEVKNTFIEVSDETPHEAWRFGPHKLQMRAAGDDCHPPLPKKGEKRQGSTHQIQGET